MGAERVRTWEKVWAPAKGGGSKQGNVDYGYEAKLPLLEGLLPAGAGSRVLEVGCGSGRLSIQLSKRRAAEIFLIDVSKNALTQSSDLARDLSVQAEYAQADGIDLPFRDSEFDLVWNSGVNQYFVGDDRQRVFDEMARVAKPGGHVLVSVPNKLSVPFHLHVLLRHAAGTWDRGCQRPYTPWELRTRMSALQDVRVYGAGVMDSFTYLLPQRSRSAISNTIRDRVDPDTIRKVGQSANFKNPASKLLGWYLIAAGKKPP